MLGYACPAWGADKVYLIKREEFGNPNGVVLTRYGAPLCFDSAAHASAWLDQQAGATGTTPDHIQLHMQAVNSLSRCKAMLTAKEPMYLYAQELLAQAKQAIEALQALELQQEI